MDIENCRTGGLAVASALTIAGFTATDALLPEVATVAVWFEP